MKSRWIVLPLGLAILLAAKGLTAADNDSGEKEFKATCPVSGKAAGESHMLQLKNGEKIYFCCDNCPKAYKKNPKKFALQVNRQLLETGQIEQVACPVTGKPINKDDTVEMGNAKVSFCCEHCLAKFKAADDEGKLKMVFGPAGMKKGFKHKNEKEKKSAA